MFKKLPFARQIYGLRELFHVRHAVSLFRKLAGDGFLRNVFVLASGTIVSQVIILATLPILTRLYSPSEYGTYSMYLSIIGILLMIISFSYENAITLPEDDRTASSVLSLSLRICIGVSIASGIGIHILEGPLAAWMHESYVAHYYLLFIVSLFGAGFYQILNYWSIRKNISASWRERNTRKASPRCLRRSGSAYFNWARLALSSAILSAASAASFRSGSCGGAM